MAEQDAGLVAPELVVHVFAPVDGPHAPATHDYLHRLWEACGDRFGMRSPIDGLGLPRELPVLSGLDLSRVRAGLAARGRHGAGVFQALLRREHDVLCLSVMLAPSSPGLPGSPGPAGADPSAGWASLHGQWAQISEPPPESLLGVAEVYQGMLAGPASEQVEPTAVLADACRRLLPRPPPRLTSVTSAHGFAVWEADGAEDTRPRRRVVVVAPADADAELSAWTWSRGDAEVTPFARYLLHAAKLRYHLRVWAGGEPLRRARREVDAAIGPVARLLAGSTDDSVAAGPAAPLADLRRATYHLTETVTRIRQLARSVEIAAANLAEYLPPPGVVRGGPAAPDDAAAGAAGLFADDVSLAAWFGQQLADDAVYLDAALERGTAALDTASSLRTDQSHAPTTPASPESAVFGSARQPGPPRVLVLADEWLPARGGLSALNRYLCTAVARAGAEVFCVVPASTSDERRDATGVGVRLLDALPAPGASARGALMRRPPLPVGVVPDIVVGHGRITGAYARAVQEDHFSGASRLHIVHMSPDEIEWWSPDHGSDPAALAEERLEIELALGRDATRVVAIGPRLHRWIHSELDIFDGVPEPLRLDPGFDLALDAGAGSTGPAWAPRSPPPGAPRVLLFGRIEDATVKGLDIAARAVGHAAGLRGRIEPPPELLLRGSPPGQAARLRERVLEWSGLPPLAVIVRNYSMAADRLERDLRRASLVLMPSRAEGFGLVGLEAIAAGTPALVSENSGLGMLLREVLTEVDAERMLVPVRDDESDTVTWGARIHEVLGDRDAAFTRAAAVRRVMAQRRTWAGAARRLLTAVPVS